MTESAKSSTTIQYQRAIYLERKSPIAPACSRCRPAAALPASVCSCRPPRCRVIIQAEQIAQQPVSSTALGVALDQPAAAVVAEADLAPAGVPAGEHIQQGSQRGG